MVNYDRLKKENARLSEKNISELKNLAAHSRDFSRE